MIPRCLHCGRGDLCPPCKDGNPPYSPAELAAQHDTKLQAEKDDIRKQLVEIPHLLALLGQYFVAGAAPRTSENVHRGKSASPSKAPFRLDVFDLLRPDLKSGWLQWDPDDDNGPDGFRNGITQTLWLWQFLFTSEMPDTGYTPATAGGEPEDATATSLCSWFGQHLDWIATWHWGTKDEPDFNHAIERITRTLRRIAGDETREWHPCPNCGWDMAGQGEYDDDLGRYPWYDCTGGCGKTITTANALDELTKAAQNVVTLAFAANELKRPVSTLKEWKQRGWISPIGKDARGLVYSMRKIRKAAKRIEHGKPHKASTR